MNRKPNCVCSVCGKTIYRRPIQIATGNVFCSLVCCGAKQRVSHTCRICGNEYVGAKRTCSRACANKARSGIKYLGENALNKAKRSNFLREQVARKRGGICERCGEENYAILQVHHKVERYRGGTDTLTNLELLCPNCHARHHLGFDLFVAYKSAKVLRTNR